ncbi:MAG: KEOPS complex subunit Cgi121 [Candidatus Thorarchaeota archaeon SMTZ1-83]
MRLETLTSEKGVFHIAVGELKNTKNLNKDAMISLASEKAEGIEVVQLLESALIAGEEHLLSAAQNALNAWMGNYAISRGLDVEILLYASGQYQIGVALEKMGITDESESVAAVVLATDESNLRSHVNHIIDRIGSEVRQPFAPTQERIQSIMTHFGINETEISAVTSSDTLEARYQALSGCVTSRVSMVALDS